MQFRRNIIHNLQTDHGEIFPATIWFVIRLPLRITGSDSALRRPSPNKWKFAETSLHPADFPIPFRSQRKNKRKGTERGRQKKKKEGFTLGACRVSRIRPVRGLYAAAHVRNVLFFNWPGDVLSARNAVDISPFTSFIVRVCTYVCIYPYIHINRPSCVCFWLLFYLCAGAY